MRIKIKVVMEKQNESLVSVQGFIQGFKKE